MPYLLGRPISEEEASARKGGFLSLSGRIMAERTERGKYVWKK